MANPFKKLAEGTKAPMSPEALFSELPRRPGGPKNLWSTQADALRTYLNEGFDKKTNVSLELPTGTGKTLVALLIAEWRRLALDERVVFLCPNRQLARQVHEKAQGQYGINTSLLIGGKRAYAPADEGAFLARKKVAVATYSEVFNTNPGISSPDCIIFDDCHVSESLIAGMWSLTVERRTAEDLYSAVVDVLLPYLPANLVANIDSRTSTGASCELLPDSLLDRLAPKLREAINPRVAKGTDPFYRWQAIRDNLDGCNLFVSPSEVLIRPEFPPTLTHDPVRSAKHRFFMSATIGTSGDLERITGIPGISSIPPPKTTEDRGNGRRLFLFPSMAATDDAVWTWLRQSYLHSQRVLVLTRDFGSSDRVSSAINHSGIPITLSKNLEDTLEDFTSAPNGALIAASRFDGIDLPDDVCRMTAIADLPDAVNLQDRFLLTRLGMKQLLRQRIITRITQAAGRCVRNQADYAVVICVGRDLLKFMSEKHNQTLMNAELAAEVQVGIDLSTGATLTDLEQMIASFMTQSSDWQSVNALILEKRASMVSARTLGRPIRELLQRNADAELEYQYAIWGRDYSRAISRAKQVVDGVNVQGLELYKAWWAYKLATAYARSGNNAEGTAAMLNAEKALAVARTVGGLSSWFGALPSVTTHAEASPSSKEPPPADAIEHFLSSLERLALDGPRFEAFAASVERDLVDTGSKTLETAARRGAWLMGWKSEEERQDGDPDAYWYLGREAIGFEMKTDVSKGKPIPKKHLTEAEGHRKWLKERLGSDCEVAICFVTDQESIDPLAVPFSKDLFLLRPEELRNIMRQAIQVARGIRDALADTDSEASRAEVLDRWKATSLLPREIMGRLTTTPLEILVG